MVQILNLSRRDMLKTVGATGALVLGAHVATKGLFGEAQAAGAAAAPNHFVAIDPTGMVTLTCSRSEMGQGVHAHDHRR
jgi:CO/xanthine dehydrogenase Mo-binding subunit